MSNIIRPYFIFCLCLLFACQSETPPPPPVQAAVANTSSESPAKEMNPSPKIDPSITQDYLMGKFDPTTHPDFTKIESRYASNARMLLRKEAYADFIRMYEAAKKDGITLTIISATRPFAHQKRIWEAKWNGQRKVGGKDLSQSIPDPNERALKILEYSSMPGTSRHHWGTDVDFNDLNNSYFEKGKGKLVYEWLTAHAAEYGFCQPYSPKGTLRPYGYEEEKWHWSYLPLAQRLTEQYRLQIGDHQIEGFAGAKVAPQIKVVERYVLGINKACL